LRRSFVSRRKKPGYPLVSFLPAAKKDTAPIPCAGQTAAQFDLTEFSLRENSKNCGQTLAWPVRGAGIRIFFPFVRLRGKFLHSLRFLPEMRLIDKEFYLA
jgi:hypothetical protein